jgi:hypothetical protein
LKLNLYIVVIFTILSSPFKCQTSVKVSETDLSEDTVDCNEYNVYYYSLKCKYPENSLTLKNECNLFLKKSNKSYSGSGYITFRFKIDCEGKIANNLEILQVDEEYKKKLFETRLINDLFLFIKTLSKWKIAISKSEKYYSYNTYLTFKINNGEITNIIP